MAQHQPAYQIDLDPDFARAAVHEGCTLLLLDVPDGTQFSIDHQAFMVGPRFKGLKMLPPGTHFVACAATSKEGQVAMPTGFFLHVAAQQVVVRKWDPAMEMLAPLQDDDEAERYAAGARRLEFDAHLAPYDLRRLSEWRSLSQYITKDVIDALSPVGGNISIMDEALDPSLMEPKTEAEKRLVAQLQEGRQRSGATPHTEPAAPAQPMEVEAAAHERGHSQAEPSTHTPSTSRCFYTRLPRLVKAPGVSAAQLTAMNLDRSGQLDSILASRYTGRDEMLLGELQFAFVAFMYGQSLDGFQQWKSLLSLLLGCEDAPLRTRQPFFTNVLKVLHAQLLRTLGTEATPGGIVAPLGGNLVDEMLPNSFLRQLFGNFFEMLQDNTSEVGRELSHQAQRLQQLLKEKLGWDFQMQLLEEEDDEFAPVVVQL